MSSKIPFAIRDDQRVTLADVERGEKGLTCFYCGDKLAVKDGEIRGRHFSHISNSKCHGEGLAHFRLKMGIYNAIVRDLKKPKDQRNLGGQIQYPCPEPDYQLKCHIKNGVPLPGQSQNLTMNDMVAGYHFFDLLENLHTVKYEASIPGTRPDIAGFDQDDNLLWVIEIKRTSLSKAAIKHARETGIPTFIIDISAVPKPPPHNPYAEVVDFDWVQENLNDGFLPAAAESYNTTCYRKEAGAGPTDRSWHTYTMIDEEGQQTTLHHCSNKDCQYDIQTAMMTTTG